MRLNILLKIKIVIVIFCSLLFLALYSSKEGDKKIKKTTGINGGNLYTLEVNRIKLPLNSRGVLADVSFQFDEADFDGVSFLFSGGFILSGLNNGEMWANGNASASRVEDYLPGEVGGVDDPRAILYVVKSADEPFGESWQEWRDAVDLGAYFYDGDNDGMYNPIDKNGNGQWNTDEDMPDLLGDETVWCVYNDAMDPSSRRFTDQDPMGIEIRQTVWAYADTNYLGNVIFIRYSINNAGRWNSFVQNASSRPYLKYHQLDRKTKRKSHVPFNNKISRFDDPIWDIISPPSDWLCGCYLTAHTEGEFGSKISKRKDFIKLTKKNIPEEWAYNPGKEVYYPDLDNYSYDVAAQWVEGGLTSPDFKQFFKGDVESNYPFAVLDQKYRNLINAKTQAVLLSRETLVKNKLHHPEISFKEYKQLPGSVANAKLIIRDRSRTLVFIKRNGRYYYSVIKATSKGELFLTSFRYTSESDLNRMRKQGKVLRDEI